MEEKSDTVYFKSKIKGNSYTLEQVIEENKKLLEEEEKKRESKRNINKFLEYENIKPVKNDSIIIDREGSLIIPKNLSTISLFEPTNHIYFPHTNKNSWETFFNIGFREWGSSSIDNEIKGDFYLFYNEGFNSNSTNTNYSFRGVKPNNRDIIQINTYSLWSSNKWGMKFDYKDYEYSFSMHLLHTFEDSLPIFKLKYLNKFPRLKKEYS